MVRSARRHMHYISFQQKKAWQPTVVAALLVILVMTFRSTLGSDPKRTAREKDASQGDSFERACK